MWKIKAGVFLFEKSSSNFFRFCHEKCLLEISMNNTPYTCVFHTFLPPHVLLVWGEIHIALGLKVQLVWSEILVKMKYFEQDELVTFHPEP